MQRARLYIAKAYINRPMRVHSSPSPRKGQESEKIEVLQNAMMELLVKKHFKI